ncbi:MAG: insulinase family protein [Spirochaetales bacterium]|nr:insulinase family protein [Spirochaetales bacterium]
MNSAGLSSTDRAGGFQLLAGMEMGEYGCRALHYRHLNTGCEVFHLHNEDPENLFAFAFRTPPSDDSGAAHILEHAVLCGSRRFPLKDPFLVLLKSSLQTFLNAFTFPDKTVYPASSMVENDFFNLMLVAGDAVFFPLLEKEVFMQEAHHLEPERPQQPAGSLKRSGVVFNEMKGVFSSAESVVSDTSLRSLFPDSPYGFESGGDPRAIAALTLDRLEEFHRLYYHPGNCRIFLYGNIPTPVTLRFLERNFLDSFGPAEIRSAVAPQPRWRRPCRMEKTYPAEAGKSTVTMNWLTAPVTDPLGLLSFEVLSEILVGNEGAALSRALLESKLGDDLSPATGLETEINELVFTVGLRGTQAAEDFEKLVLSTLEELADGAVAQRSVEAALHRVEFRNSEIQRGGRPYSLTLMRRALRGWLHGSDPHSTLEFRRPMDALRAASAGGGYFEGLIREFLLDNPHRSTVVVRPDPDQQKREQEEERQELERIRVKLGPEGLKRLQEDLQRLRIFQEKPDSPEVISRIPALHLEDLRREVEIIPGERPVTTLPTPVLVHELFTNGVVYLDLAFDISAADERLQYLLPLFSRAVRGSGLPEVPYYDMAQRLSLYTGGFGASLSADTSAAPDRAVQRRLIFRVKMLEANIEQAVQLVRDLLLRANFRDFERLKTIVLEMRNDLKASLVPAGSHYAALRASARISGAAEVEEKWKGITQYVWMDALSGPVGREEGRLRELASSLEALRAQLLDPSRLSLNLTCEQGAVDRTLTAAGDLVARLGRHEAEQRDRPHIPGVCPEGPPPASSAEALIGSMNVSFVARALPASLFGSSESAHEAVLAHFLNTGFLWEQVRMKGGAYGAGASANGLEGLFVFSSYRDPGTVTTLDAFREALRYAAAFDPDADTFEKIVLGAAGKEERPMAPGEKGFVALKRDILGVTDAERQLRRDALIECTPGQLREAARRLLAAFDGGATTIVTHRQAVEADRQRLEQMNICPLVLPE